MKLHQALLIVLTALLVPSPASGQQPAEPQPVVKITLHPMPPPRPALQYQLLPPLLERRPGNAAVWWNRIPAERWNFLNDLYKAGGPWEKIDKWMALPLGDPRERQLRAELSGLNSALGLYREMAYAARFESCDWQLPIREGNIVMMSLSEVQQTRTYGRLLAAKAHLEIAEGRYGDAVATLQTGFALARDITRGQTLVNGLVGVAIAAQMATQVEQLVQQPDAPNLYWALATLPRPLIDFGPAFETESHFLYLQFPDLKDLDKKDLAPDQWRKLLNETFADWQKIMPLCGSKEAFLATAPEVSVAALSLLGYPMAKQYLIEHGRRAADVEAMPVAKVVLLHSVAVYQELADEQFKLMLLSYAEGKKCYAQVDRDIKEAVSHGREIFQFAGMLLPAVSAAKQAEARMQWIVVHLQIFEALRIYAAAYDGKLPERLEDVAEVPVPRNPFDDQPFKYHRDGNRAVLEAEHGPVNYTVTPWRHEITMVPQAK